MATPNLDNELLKLRRRIGDVYTDEGDLFTLSPSSNLDKDGSAVSSAELVDIYNTAIRNFIRMMVNAVPKNRWSYILPGYVIIKPNVSPLTDIQQTEIQADYIDFTSIDNSGNILEIIQLHAISGTPHSTKKGHNIGVYFPPNNIYDVIINSNDVMAKQTMYTIINTSVDSQYERRIMIVPKSENPENALYSVVYLKGHNDFVRGSGTDLSYSDIPLNTLDLILLFAEKEYTERRQFDNFEMTQQKITEALNILRR